MTAEVIARVASEGFGLLDAPPQRLNAKDTPVPYHPNLWAAHRPTARSIAAPPAISCAMSERRLFQAVLTHACKIPIIMPQLGESIAEATIVSLPVQSRRQVEATRTSSKWKPTKPP